MPPGEGLTVVAALPTAAVSPPSASTLLWWSLLDNRRWIFGGLGFVLVFGYYFFAWRAVGRDPKPGTIIPLFHPPKGVSPALANYIHRWGFGREKWRAFTAAALSLAVRGLIQFDDSDETLTLKKLQKKPEGGMDALPPGERAIFDWVKGQGGVAKINRANGKAVATVGAEFTSSIESESRNRFFRRNFGYVVVGLVLTALVIIGTAVFGGLRDVDYLVLFGFFFGGMMVGAFVVPLLTALVGAHGFRRIVSVVMTLVVLSIFFSIGVNFIVFFFPHGFGGTLSALWAFFESYPFSFVLVTSFAALNGLFFYLMRAPTALGRPIMDQLEGFKLYLETAEKDRLNLSAPEITAERFEALLPYAVALDVEKPWADAFAAALTPGAPGRQRSHEPLPAGLAWRAELVGRRFRQRHRRDGRRRHLGAGQLDTGVVRLLGLFERWWRRLRRRWGRRRRLVAAFPGEVGTGSPSGNATKQKLISRKVCPRLDRGWVPVFG